MLLAFGLSHPAFGISGFMGGQSGFDCGFFLVYITLLIVFTFVMLGLMLFAEHRKLEELESYFSKNKMVLEHKRKWGVTRDSPDFIAWV